MKISIAIIACALFALITYSLCSCDKPLKVIPKIITTAVRAAQKRASREAYEIAYGKVVFVYGYNSDTGMQTMLPYDVISRLHTYQRKISSKPMDPDVPEGFYGGDCLSKQTYYRKLPLEHQENGFKTQANLIMAASIIPRTAQLYQEVYRAELDKKRSVDAAHIKAADAVTQHYIKQAEAYSMNLRRHISWESFVSSH